MIETNRFYRKRMKDFLLCAHVVVRTSNLKMLRRRLVDYVKNCTQERASRAARLVFLIQPIMLPIFDVAVAVIVS